MKLLLENWKKYLNQEYIEQKPSVRLEILIDDLDEAVLLVEDPTAIAALESIVKELLAVSKEMSAIPASPATPLSSQKQLQLAADEADADPDDDDEPEEWANDSDHIKQLMKMGR